MQQNLIYLKMLIFMMMLILINVLISVAFLTLMERKFLSYIQIRKGPNKLGFLGVFQPISDLIKLMMKELIFLSKINYLMYLISPMISFSVIMMMWLLYPFYSNYLMMNMGLIYLMCCFSMSVYGNMLGGWSSNSMYSMLGSLRSLAQSISYEVVLSIILIIPMLLINSMNLKDLLYVNKFNWLMILLFPLFLMFLISVMAELNRTPFDFSEGESELVSGFNVEYMSSGFIIFFISEYASIMFISLLFNMYFWSGMNYNMFYFLKVMFLMFLIIWIRGTLPRFRYDLLMYFCWLMILPLILNYMMYIIFLKKIIYK